jgi:hypothetical protein
MRWSALMCGAALLLGGVAAGAQAGDGTADRALPTPPVSTTPASVPSATSPSVEAGPLAPAGSLAADAPVPSMIGDPGIGVAARLRGVPGNVLVPIVTRGSFKIAENESPRPQERVFINFNYLNTTNTFGPGAGSFDLYRETIGFEKTFLDGDASFGFRVPIIQKDGLSSISMNGFGDISLLLKFAALCDHQTGNVLSGGLVVTAPSGRNPRLITGSDFNSTLLQPWVGFIYNEDRFYTHGFAAVIIPTEARDVTFLAGDLGAGYRLAQARGSIITAVVPTLEAHLNIPLNRGGVGSGLVGFPDQFITTAGVHLGLCHRAFLTFGAATPLFGPRPFEFEYITQLNVVF